MTVTVDMQKEKDTVTATHSVQLLNETKTALSKALFENTGNNTITIKNVFPKFVKSSSEHVFLSQLMSFDSSKYSWSSGEPFLKGKKACFCGLQVIYFMGEL